MISTSIKKRSMKFIRNFFRVVGRTIFGDLKKYFKSIHYKLLVLNNKLIINLLYQKYKNIKYRY